MQQLQNKLEVIRGIEKDVESSLTEWLRPAGETWQSFEFLPRMDEPDAADKIREIRSQSARLSDALLLVLIGNMITEEALPSYETWFSQLDGMGGHGGISANPWAKWMRGWTSEENKHGEVLLLYLYLTGRADMIAVSRTIQYLIANGFDPQTDNDPYMGLVYTSFQERATNISHRNTGRIAIKEGDPLLGKICTIIAGDEARHEKAYKNLFKRVLEVDPEGGVSALAEMMRRKVIMPAKNMADKEEKNLFIQHIVTAQKMGVYTAKDYAEVIRHLVDFWEIATIKNLSGQAAEDQDYLCGLAAFYEKKAAQLSILANLRPKIKNPWLFGRSV